MNRRLVIIVLALPLVLTVGIFIVVHLLSFRSLNIELGEGVSATIYITKDSNSKEIKKISTSTNIPVQDGTYIISPEGDKIDTSDTRVEIKGKDVSVSIDPSYSSIYLNELLQNEKESINSAIVEQIPEASSGYLINTGTLVDKGEWYVTTFTKRVEYSDMSSDVYRTILKKNTNTWTVVTRPTLTISYSSAKEVPKSIVDKANLLPGDSGRAYEKFRVRQNNSNLFFEDR